jgi:ATP-dependent Zn protease
LTLARSRQVTHASFFLQKNNKKYFFSGDVAGDVRISVLKYVYKGKEKRGDSKQVEKKDGANESSEDVENVTETKTKTDVPPGDNYLSEISGVSKNILKGHKERVCCLIFIIFFFFFFFLLFFFFFFFFLLLEINRESFY